MDKEARSAMDEMARYAREFYDACRERDFTKDQALALTQTYLNAALTRSPTDAARWSPE